jgi:hypothetical protein
MVRQPRPPQHRPELAEHLEIAPVSKACWDYHATCHMHMSCLHAGVCACHLRLRERSPVIMHSDDASLDRHSGECTVRRTVLPRSRLPPAGNCCNCAFAGKGNSGEFFGKRKLQCSNSHIDAPSVLVIGCTNAVRQSASRLDRQRTTVTSRQPLLFVF